MPCVFVKELAILTGKGTSFIFQQCFAPKGLCKYNYFLILEQILKTYIMETNKTPVKCCKCHRTFLAPKGQSTGLCPYCNTIVCVFVQELPKDKKSSTLEKNGIEDK